MTVTSTFHEEENVIHLIPPAASDRDELTRWRTMSEDYEYNPECIEHPSEIHTLITKHSFVDHHRHINYLLLAFMTYFAVSGGPFGIEPAVRAAGGMPVLIGILILPFIWGLPQALMTAELSTMINENGGSILWVTRGLGPFAGFMNAYNSIIRNICDLPTYVVLFESYMEAYVALIFQHQTTALESWILKACSLCIVVLFNIFGLRAVAFGSIAMSLFIMSPFLLQPLFTQSLGFEAWKSVAPEIDWPLFLSTLLWNYQGWDSLGSIAGEVKNGEKTYPLGFLVVMILITVSYIVPVCVGLDVLPDTKSWREGTLEVIAMQISTILGSWIALAAVVSILGQMLVAMACYSRSLWACAMHHLLPRWIGLEWKKYRTPVVAILVQGAGTACLMCFPFTDLVVIDTFFNNITLLLEFIAYLRLRYIEPDTHRGFRVPGGKIGAWMITLPKILVLIGVLLAQKPKIWMICGGINVVFLVLYYITGFSRRAYIDLTTNKR